MNAKRLRSTFFGTRGKRRNDPEIDALDSLLNEAKESFGVTKADILRRGGRLAVAELRGILFRRHWAWQIAADSLETRVLRTALGHSSFRDFWERCDEPEILVFAAARLGASRRLLTLTVRECLESIRECCNEPLVGKILDATAVVDRSHLRKLEKEARRSAYPKGEPVNSAILAAGDLALTATNGHPLAYRAASALLFASDLFDDSDDWLCSQADTVRLQMREWPVLSWHS